MILGIITTIFSSLGIYGFFTNNYVLLYIGMGFVIFEHAIGIRSGQQKGLTTVWISLLFAFGMICAGSNWINAIALCLCFEGTICFILGIILMFFSIICSIKKQNKNNIDNSKEIIQELIDKSGLSKQLCTDVFEILVCFSYNDKELAYSKIDTQLIPHLKETANLSDIGIAFGMLIDENALSEEESRNYSSKLIENLVINE